MYLHKDPKEKFVQYILREKCDTKVKKTKKPSKIIRGKGAKVNVLL